MTWWIGDFFNTCWKEWDLVKKMVSVDPQLPLLCSFILYSLMEKAKQQCLIKGFAIDNVDQEVTHLQFADDTITFCDASMTR